MEPAAGDIRRGRHSRLSPDLAPALGLRRRAVDGTSERVAPDGLRECGRASGSPIRFDALVQLDTIDRLRGWLSGIAARRLGVDGITEDHVGMSDAEQAIEGSSLPRATDVADAVSHRVVPSVREPRVSAAHNAG